jgi:hypothetical protein
MSILFLFTLEEIEMEGQVSLDSLSREQLIEKIHSLQPKITHTSPQTRTQKPFLFDMYGSRRIAIRFAYKGQEYSGLTSASVSDSVRTVEGEIFNALIRSKLIPDRSVTDFSRCGRTDKV